MSFSDDDLKRLKNMSPTAWTEDEADALLARLEAGEKFNDETRKAIAKIDEFYMTQGMILSYDAWRKACGE